MNRGKSDQNFRPRAAVRPVGTVEVPVPRGVGERRSPVGIRRDRRREMVPGLVGLRGFPHCVQGANTLEVILRFRVGHLSPFVLIVYRCDSPIA